MLTLKFCILTVFLSYLSYVDIHTRKIPNKIIAILLVLAFIFMPFESNLLSYIIGLFLPGLIFLIISIIGGHFIGSGDIKIIICLGGFLGTSKTLFISILACIICLLYSILLKLLGIKQNTLAFCPFLLISFLILSI